MSGHLVVRDLGRDNRSAPKSTPGHHNQMCDFELLNNQFRGYCYLCKFTNTEQTVSEPTHNLPRTTERCRKYQSRLLLEIRKLQEQLVVRTDDDVFDQMAVAFLSLWPKPPAIWCLYRSGYNSFVTFVDNRLVWYRVCQGGGVPVPYPPGDPEDEYEFIGHFHKSYTIGEMKRIFLGTILYGLKFLDYY